MNQGEVVEGEIARIGTYKASSGTVTFDDRTLAELEANWKALSAAGYRVPLVLGHIGLHAGDAQPSVGWLSELVRRGRSLFARFTHVPRALAEAIRARRWEDVSIEAYPRIEATSHGQLAPQARGFALQRVSVLAATRPAIAGMQPLRVLDDVRALLAADGLETIMCATATDEGVVRVMTGTPATLPPEAVALAETAASWGLSLDDLVERQQALALARAGKRDHIMTQDPDNDRLVALGEALDTATTRFALRHNLDLGDPHERRIAQGGAGDSDAARQLAEYYRSPREARPAAVARFAEEQSALEVAVVATCRRLGLDATNRTDRAVALSEIASDPRHRGTLVPDYSTGTRREADRR